jgi:DNA-binding transcriptional regulator YiaG
MEPSSKRTRTPRHAPHPRVIELRSAGWTISQIAQAVGTTMRQVSRWSAGDTRPLRIYENLLTSLSTTPPVRA